MDLWTVLKAAIMGIVEGLTEFLPVSSTGHLIIVGDLLGLTSEAAKTFEIFIQLGAILGVVWHFHDKIIDVISHLNRPPQQRFALNVLIAFMPAMIVGVALHGTIKHYLFNPISVACALIAGGLAILWIERRPYQPRIEHLDDLKPMDALKVGLAQTLAMFPGVSRSGATIMGGLLLGLSRQAATEFSFFLAMPTMLAATVYDLYKSREIVSLSDGPVFLVGFLFAFVTALVVVRLFVAYVARHDFTVFAYYRIVFGVLVLFYFL